jgi:predicted PurR-regulated permease PerM
MAMQDREQPAAPPRKETERQGDVRFVRRLLLAILVVGTALLAWELRFVLVLAFGAVLLGVILRGIAERLRGWFGLSEQLALTATLLLIVLLLGGIFYLFGAEVVQQARDVSDALPAALTQLEQLGARFGLGSGPGGWADDLGLQSAISNVGSILLTVGDGTANLVILIFGGIFLAARPKLYRTGLIKLVPEESRGKAASALDHCGGALRLWFKGRVLAMIFVGLLTGVGLWLIGVPAFLALGLLAAVLEFIPFFGPLLAAVPAVLLALLLGPEEALMVAGLLLVIQQAEGNLITPLIQQHAVDLPPALLLFSLLGFGMLFGIVGIVLAEPLTVAVFVLIKQFYVRGALHTDTPIPGEDD